jgi:hypothetical protein
MRTQRKVDIHGVTQCWIMIVKDYSTSLIHLSALPRKKALFVAHELEIYFGFVSYLQSFYTNNGNEFIAKVVVDLLKMKNLHCFIVTSQPRTPRDQGLVESGNKLLQQIMKSISSKQQQAGLKDNWTKFLGQSTGCCNSYSC